MRVRTKAERIFDLLQVKNNGMDMFYLFFLHRFLILCFLPFVLAQYCDDIVLSVLFNVHNVLIIDNTTIDLYHILFSFFDLHQRK